MEELLPIILEHCQLQHSALLWQRTIALAKLVVKVEHICALLHDLQCHQEHKTTIQSTCVWVDNTATIAVAQAMGNDFTHETVKHVTAKV